MADEDSTNDTRNSSDLDGPWRQDLLENAEDIVYTQDLDGRLTSVSRAVERVSGYGRDEVLRMDIRQVLAPSSIEIAVQALHDLTSGNPEPQKCELELLTKGGSRIWLECTSRIQYRDGQPAGIHGIARNITGQKVAERALRESEERYRTVVELLGEGIAMVDEHERFLVVNPAAETIFGVPPGGLAGRNLRDFVDTDSLESLHSETKLRLRGEKSSYELRIVRADGERRTLLVTATPQFDADHTFRNSIGVFRDITGQKRLEQRIKLLAHALESVEECVTIADGDDRLLFVNRAFLRSYGYEEHELTGRHIGIVWSPLNPAQVTSAILPATLAGGWAGELWNRRKDGTDFPVMLTTAPIPGEGSPEATVGVARDISERRRAEEALRRSEANLRAAQAIAHVGSWHFDITQNTATCSDETRRIYRVTAGEPLRYDWFLEAVHPDDRAAVHQAWVRALAGEPFDLECRIQVGDETKWVRERAEVEFDKEGKPLRGLGTVQDITARKNAEVALRQSETALLQSQERLRRLTAGLFTKQEDERRRISRELHDDLSQRLAMLGVEVEMMERGLPASPEVMRGQLQSLHGRIARLSDDVRRTAYQLHPSVLEHVGLVAALRSYCAQVTEQEQLKVTFRHRAVPEEIPHEVALCLYRVSQESLRNAAKHSGCSEASVSLTGTRGGIHLTIADRGSGFDPRVMRTGTGLGVVSMEERVRLAGGSLSITSQPEEGTRVEVRIPFAGARK